MKSTPMRATAPYLLALLLLGCGDSDELARDGGAGGSEVTAGADTIAADRARESGLRIALDAGELQGELVRGARRFLGIPYASPPLGPLRWKAPEPAPPWSGVLDTSAFRARCPQPGGDAVLPAEEEDCLYLNVWSPQPAPATPRPVMVWIHGGGNVAGSASDEVPARAGHALADGTSFAVTHGLVVVTLNYRLGALGFFAHPALRDEGSPLGNQGLLDQRLALRWVQDNIARFGGDPDNVTVFGESAGAFDTCFQVAAGDGGGLFHAAISQSGGCTGNRVREAADVAAGLSEFAQAMGCDALDGADVLSCLREMPVETLLTPAPVDGADEALLPGGARYASGTARWSFGAVIDGELLPEHPRALFAGGAAADVPYILGSNTDEGTAFHLFEPPVQDEAQYLAALERRFGSELAAKVAQRYPVSEFESPNAALMRLTGDVNLVCGTHDSARVAAEAGLRVYMYNFDQPLPVPGFEWLGATHAAEIAYVFNTISDFTPEQQRVADAMQGYWARFAERGDPNGDDAVMWPRFHPDDDLRLQLGASIEPLEDFRSELCEFWRTEGWTAHP